MHKSFKSILNMLLLLRLGACEDRINSVGFARVTVELIPPYCYSLSSLFAGEPGDPQYGNGTMVPHVVVVRRIPDLVCLSLYGRTWPAIDNRAMCFSSETEQDTCQVRTHVYCSWQAQLHAGHKLYLISLIQSVQTTILY